MEGESKDDVVRESVKIPWSMGFEVQFFAIWLDHGLFLRVKRGSRHLR